MKKLLLLLPLMVGCAYVRPHAVETATSTNGVITRREIWLPGFAIWPAGQTVDKQRASIGKTVSAGMVDVNQDGGGTNVVEALRAIDSILGKIR